jgi:HlyD family secretion protein
MLSRQVFIQFISTVALLAATGCSHPPTNVYQGYIEGRFVYVASPQSGRLQQLSVRRGEVITTGQPLFVLDDQPEADEVQQAQKVLHSAGAKLSDLETGKRPAEIDVTRAQLQQALAEKKQADQILASDDAQYRSGGISQLELIQARANAEMSAAKMQEMEASLAVDALPAREPTERSRCRSRCARRRTVEVATKGDCFATPRVSDRHALPRWRMGYRRQPDCAASSTGEP